MKLRLLTILLTLLPLMASAEAVEINGIYYNLITKGNIAEVTNNTIVLGKNENWWNKEQKSTIENITINLYSTVAEMYNAFKMGNIDLINTENQNYQDYI